MAHASRNKLVFTVKDKCKICYTCVRECPVKAIKVVNGQAEVISARCIGCGNCVTVCSQGAKIYLDSRSDVYNLLKSDKPVIAMVAPSFPAEFSEIEDYNVFVGMIKQLGFDKIVEVSFGADLISREYAEVVEKSDKPLISSDCPAIVYYIEHYYPDLVPSLAPIASPMVAIARIVKKEYGDVHVVFIGPCVAKKAESDEIDEALTFYELRLMFEQSNVTEKNAKPQKFDPPYSGKGAIFPVSRGLLQNLNKTDDISEGKIIVADGSKYFREAIEEMSEGSISDIHLELLSCEGCIMGPGMSKNGSRYARRTSIGRYVKGKLENLDKNSWNKDIEKFRSLDFSQTFTPADRRTPMPDTDEIYKVMQSLNKFEEKDQLNCGACGYNTCQEHAVAILEGLSDIEMCLPFSIEKLHNSIEDLYISNTKLLNAKKALKQSEKLAHMGQLSAGIAHELNNPLGVITMYSNIILEEAKDDDPIKKDLQLIVEQTERCKKIVGGLLNFARKSQVNLSETNMEDFCKHSLKSIIAPENINCVFKSNLSNSYAMIDSDQMMQVLNNLEKNAIEAMPKGGQLTIEINGDDESIEINISDSGTGISKSDMDKIFTPFFTTKEIGKGTGLGLPLVYGIVKMHRGQILVTSNDDKEAGPTGTNFKIVLPRNIINK